MTTVIELFGQDHIDVVASSRPCTAKGFNGDVVNPDPLFPQQWYRSSPRTTNRLRTGATRCGHRTARCTQLVIAGVAVKLHLRHHLVLRLNAIQIIAHPLQNLPAHELGVDNDRAQGPMFFGTGLLFARSLCSPCRELRARHLWMRGRCRTQARTGTMIKDLLTLL